ncbi:hypothetical protein ACN6K8_001885 [[Kitasatospora] papulosa]|uniref:hypothetical protein n=1 Tax=Streptomyces TaxID=1883 RepID=UPI00343349BE
MIGLITGLLETLIALGTAVWTNAKAGRRQELLQRAQWEHDRRREAYTTVSRAARAFVPLTEQMFLLAGREEAANTTPLIHELPLDSNDEQMELRITWHDALQPDVIMEPGEKWKKDAPLLLQELAAACDGADLEGLLGPVRRGCARLLQRAPVVSTGSKGDAEEVWII